MPRSEVTFPNVKSFNYDDLRCKDEGFWTVFLFLFCLLFFVGGVARCGILNV